MLTVSGTEFCPCIVYRVLPLVWPQWYWLDCIQICPGVLVRKAIWVTLFRLLFFLILYTFLFWWVANRSNELVDYLKKKLDTVDQSLSDLECSVKQSAKNLMDLKATKNALDQHKVTKHLFFQRSSRCPHPSPSLNVRRILFTYLKKDLFCRYDCKLHEIKCHLFLLLITPASSNFAVTMRDILQLICPNKAWHLDFARKSTQIMCFSPIFLERSLVVVSNKSIW